MEFKKGEDGRMRAFITTVAGQSSRFNPGSSEPVLKCLYHTDRVSECILYRLIRQAVNEGFDRLIVVGGYRYQDLQYAVDQYSEQNQRSIELVFNPRWQDAGSMYSLYYGVQAAAGAAEIVFCEGDIIVDDKSFQQICSANRDSFAVSFAPIYADRSVVGYQGVDDRLHYLYDTLHGQLTFPTSVKAIFNSAQAWKITDVETFRRLNTNLSETERCGTNLVLLEKYFARFPLEQASLVPFCRWINCNTREDFLRYEENKTLFTDV